MTLKSGGICPDPVAIASGSDAGPVVDRQYGLWAGGLMGQNWATYALLLT